MKYFNIDDYEDSLMTPQVKRNKPKNKEDEDFFSSRGRKKIKPFKKNIKPSKIEDDYRGSNYY